MAFLFRLLASIGLMLILKEGKPLGWFRRFLDLIRLTELYRCSLCLGFWCGGVVYLISTPQPFPYTSLFLNALASAGVCKIVSKLLKPQVIEANDF